MPPTIALGNYSVRTETSPDVQYELIQEQAQRQLKGERVSLMTLAGEWLEEIAQQKREKREKQA